MIYHKYEPAFQFAQEKTKRIEELNFSFFKVFERVGGARSSVLLTPGSSQGFYPPQYLVETMNL